MRVVAVLALVWMGMNCGWGAAPKPVDYFVVVTGGELLEGVYADAHTPFLTRTLRPLGCRCVGSLIVDDERKEIFQALRFATNKAPIVIVTGGLGPTPNDITRETLSEFTGIALRENGEALADMEKRFGVVREKLRPNLRRQTLVPERGACLKNGAGTAVGLVFELGERVIVALPGPPRELQPMARDELAPYLRKRFGVREFGSSLTLRFVGAGQSLIDQTIKEHVAVAPDVVITSLFESSRVDFTFSLPGNTPDDRERLKRLGESIREHLGEYIYADEGSSLEQVVARKWSRGRRKVVIAEVATGGQLAAALLGIKEGREEVAAAYVAPNESAMNITLGMPLKAGDISAEDRTRAIAHAALKHPDGWTSVAVGELQEEKDSTKVVWVVTVEGKRQDRDGKPLEKVVRTKRIVVRDSGEIHRSNLVTQILDWLRK